MGCTCSANVRNLNRKSQCECTVWESLAWLRVYYSIGLMLICYDGFVLCTIGLQWSDLVSL